MDRDDEENPLDPPRLPLANASDENTNTINDATMKQIKRFMGIFSHNS